MPFAGFVLNPATITTKSGNPYVAVLISWFLVQVRQYHLVLHVELVLISYDIHRSVVGIVMKWRHIALDIPVG